ncbi:MAG: hypothetical protein JWN91_1963 [Nocardioides sp.]|nr:hypothetical protein [Nocardioides sp.]
MDVSWTSRYRTLWTAVTGFGRNLASHTRHSYREAMTTYAVSITDLDAPVADDFEVRLPRTVANPRRTIWTGFAKDDIDRLPAS